MYSEPDTWTVCFNAGARSPTPYGKPTVNDGKEMGGERRFRENAWYHCCRRLGQAVRY